ncbi:MAG TPA: PDZ domain-containing protein, partial [Pirellulaceae bacterium]|nr:PDZ domain-containing protein [Pirellulaceae bacterium]
MVRKWFSKWIAPCAVATSTFALGSLCGAQEQVRFFQVFDGTEGEGATITLVSDGADATGEATTTFSAVAASKYWVGVACEPISDALKAQLKLEQGLLVRDVIAEGPAAKAKIQPLDLLLKIDDEELVTVEQLMEVVEKRGAKEFSVTLIRAGERQTVKVTPVERPAEQAFSGGLGSGLEGGPAWKKVEAELKKMQAQNKGMEMMFVRPGVMFNADRVKVFVWPKDAQLHIHKQSDQPAEIVIKRGEKSWKTTEDKLDELPPEARELVDRVRGDAMQLRMEGVPGEAATRHLRLYSTPSMPSGTPTRMSIQAVPAMPAMPINPQPPHKVTRPHMGG